MTIEQISAAIVALEAQRPVIGDELADAALAPLRAKLTALGGRGPPDAEPPAQTLRQVTVLFADIVGSTALSLHLDAEDVHALMNDALGSFTQIVDEHGGRVLQYAGDNLLAVFGSSEAREDDPERAVRCALALLAEGFEPDSGKPSLQTGLAIRVGLHTGIVLLGGGVAAENSISGITVHVAARMEQSAPPGAIRISHETYRHVRGVFDVEFQPPLRVKGVDEPVVTYLVQRAKPRAFRIATRGIEGVETRMIGRDGELEMLQRQFEKVLGERRFAATTVVGEAGLGKSRLLYEFESWAETRPESFFIFQGRATPQTQGQPYGLVRDILAWRLQIFDGDSMAVAKNKLVRGIRPLFADENDEIAEGHAHMVGQLIGLDFSSSSHVQGIAHDGRQIRNRAFHVLAQIFRRVAGDGLPLVLLIEDLHWADDGSLDFLTYLAQVDRDVPLLQIALTRPLLFDRRPDWGSAAQSERIDLPPLDGGMSRLLVNELLKKLPEVPSLLRELITGGAEGNPFYMEELVKMLVDKGALEAGVDKWRLHREKLLAADVPSTLTGILQARLDGIKPSEKLALQQASVIGTVFWDTALGTLDAAAPAALPALLERGLIMRHSDAPIEGAYAYAFCHQLLHSVTYRTLLKGHRRLLHAKVALWLSRLSDARAGNFFGAAAYHYEAAGDDANATEFLAKAAEDCERRFVHDDALVYAKKGLALIGDELNAGGTHDLCWRLLSVCEAVHNFQGRREEQREALNALSEMAESLQNDRWRAAVALRRSNLALRTGDFRAQAEAARLAIACAERAGDDDIRLNARHRSAVALVYLGKSAEGRVLATEGLSEAKRLGLTRIESMCLNVLAGIASQQGHVLEALALDQQSYELSRALGDRHNEGIALGNIGPGLITLGAFAPARDALNAALKLHRALGNRAIEPHALANLSRLALCEGQDALALTHAHAAVELARAAQAQSMEVMALCSLGDAELALGRHDAAKSAFESALDIACRNDHATRHDALAGRARVAHANGDTRDALRDVEVLLSHTASGGTYEGAEHPRAIHMTCYDVLATVGDSRAAALLQGARATMMEIADALPDEAAHRAFLTCVPLNVHIRQCLDASALSSGQLTSE